jgi:hypothetical protein
LAELPKWKRAELPKWKRAEPEWKLAELLAEPEWKLLPKWKQSRKQLQQQPTK